MTIHLRCPACDALDWETTSGECASCEYTGRCVMCDGPIMLPHEDHRYCSPRCGRDAWLEAHAEDLMEERSLARRDLWERTAP